MTPPARSCRLKTVMDRYMNMPKNRWLAFAANFGISLLIFTLILLFIFFYWYPGALFTAAGGWQGLRIIAGVDLILGPLLTLIVYDLAKPFRILVRDLLTIFVIKILCLGGGVYIVFNERPLAVTYAYDTFYVFNHSDFIKSAIDPTTLELKLMSPKIFYTDLTALSETTGDTPETIFKLHQMAGLSLVDRADLYAPFPLHREAAALVLQANKLPRFKDHPPPCVTAKLVTAYNSGIVCYDVQKQHFSKFVSTDEP